MYIYIIIYIFRFVILLLYECLLCFYKLNTTISLLLYFLTRSSRLLPAFLYISIIN